MFAVRCLRFMRLKFWGDPKTKFLRLFFYGGRRTADGEKFLLLFSNTQNFAAYFIQNSFKTRLGETNVFLRPGLDSLTYKNFFWGLFRTT